MSRPGLFLVVTCVAGAACSTEPSGSLSIALDSTGVKVTNASNITLTGGVTRTPPKTTQILVRATGGAGTPIDTVKAGRFAIKVTLNPNTANQISLVASDATGIASPAVSVTVRTDNQPPTVAQVTPADASDSIARTTPVQVKMSEPVVVAAGGGIRLVRQGSRVAGTTALSADSLTLTFTPAAQLSPNAIYRLGVAGVSDAATNLADSTLGSCFVTATTGATAAATATDPVGDVFTSSGSPGTLQSPDLVAARFAREGTLFSAVFRFVGPRVFSNVAANRASIFLDLDVDQDSTTGFITVKDWLFKNSGLDTLSSGTKAEYIIGLDPHPDLGDSAYVGKWVPPADSLEFQTMATFVPGVCGPLMGFVVPFAAIGNDDGKMNAVLMSVAASTTFLYVDPMPTKGHLTLDLSAPPGSVADLEWPAPSPGIGRHLRPRIPRALAR